MDVTWSYVTDSLQNAKFLKNIKNFVVQGQWQGLVNWSSRTRTFLDDHTTVWFKLPITIPKFWDCLPAQTHRLELGRYRYLESVFGIGIGYRPRTNTDTFDGWRRWKTTNHAEKTNNFTLLLAEFVRRNVDVHSRRQSDLCAIRTVCRKPKQVCVFRSWKYRFNRKC